MLGDVKILFGSIVDIADKAKLFRSKVSIPGYTDEIDKELLPWYYPFGGIDFLPIEGDEVSVLIFDNDFRSGFYGKKVDSKVDGVSDSDYSNYLELFKRDGVELTYTKTDGIKFINSGSGVQIEEDIVTLFVKSNTITISDKKIMLGDSGQEASLLGDKTVDLLNTIITLQQNTITEMLKMFASVVSSSSPNPLTMAIGIALGPMVTAATTTLTKTIPELKATVKQIQSKKVFIE